MTTVVLTPGDFQLFDWEFPALKKDEREATLGFKVRAAVPLNPDDYQVLPTWFTSPKKTRVLAIVLKKADFQRLGLHDPALRVLLPFSYRLKARRTGTKEIGAGVSRWTVAYRGGQYHSLTPGKGPAAPSPDPGPMGPLIEVGRTYRQGSGVWLPALVMAGALAVLVMNLVHYTDERERQLAVWTSWLQEHPVAPTPINAKATGERRIRAGFPLWKATQALAVAWSGYNVRLQSLTTRGRRLAIEAQGSSSLLALERLKLQPGFGQFQLTTSRQVKGQEEFVLEGEVLLEP